MVVCSYLVCCDCFPSYCLICFWFVLELDRRSSFAVAPSQYIPSLDSSVVLDGLVQGDEEVIRCVTKVGGNVSDPDVFVFRQ